LFFKKNGLFGKECTRISQTINLDSSIINNSIEFLGERSFIVDGKINIDAERPQRVNFQFTGALLTVPPIGLPLPPVGKVCFDSSYPSSFSFSSIVVAHLMISLKLVVIS
jgi:PAP_fibrillin